jgi:hypothetical protein
MFIINRSGFSLITSIFRSSFITSINKELIELSSNSSNNKPIILNFSEESYIKEEYKENKDKEKPLLSLLYNRYLYNNNTMSSAPYPAYNNNSNI